ncbi:MAG: glycosyltransferase [Actinobacteria bacterium]|nr:glycosyltransferase [Actinomycetota bacterium]
MSAGRGGEPRRVLALVAARNEADRVEDTVRSLAGLPVDEVVVVDDGSIDDTAAVAAGAGARVLTTPRDVGKGAALEAALRRVDPADFYLLVDGDLGLTAGNLGPVLDAVLEGRADLAVAVLPRPPTGGFGLVKRFARAAIWAAVGVAPVEPLSGQRALSAAALEACRPLAPGFGVETAMTVDALRLGFRMVEVPVDLRHRFTRRDIPGFLHRGRQGKDIVRAVLPRVLRLR